MSTLSSTGSIGIVLLITYKIIFHKFNYNIEIFVYLKNKVIVNQSINKFTITFIILKLYLMRKVVIQK